MFVSNRETYMKCIHWIHRQPRCLLMSIQPAATAPRPVKPTAATEKMDIGSPRLDDCMSPLQTSARTGFTRTHAGGKDLRLFRRPIGGENAQDRKVHPTYHSRPSRTESPLEETCYLHSMNILRTSKEQDTEDRFAIRPP